MPNHIEYLKETGELHVMTEEEIYAFISEGYQGTCNSLSEDDYDWLHKHNRFEQLDNYIFECEGWGWW